MDDNKDFVDMRDDLARQQRPAIPDTATPPAPAKSYVGLIVGLSVGGGLLLLGIFVMLAIGAVGFVRMANGSMTGSASSFGFSTLEGPVAIREHAAEFIFDDYAFSFDTIPVPHVLSGMLADGDDVRMYSHLSAFDVTAINLSFLNNNVTIMPHTDADVVVVFEVPESGNYIRAIYSLVDGMLIMHDESPGLNFRDFTNSTQGNITLYIPDASYDSIFITTTNGDVVVKGFDGFFSDEVMITVVNGRIDIENIETNFLSISSVNGSVSGQNLYTWGASASTVNGDVRLTEAVINGHLAASTVTGDVIITDVETDMDWANFSTVLGRVVIND